MAHERDGDFELQLRRHHPELLGFLRARMDNETDAADLAQEACTRLLQYHRGGQAIDDLRSLLFRIARNLLADFYRDGRRHRSDAHMALEEAGPLPSDERQQADRVADQQALARLKRVIERLPDRCRTVFVLSRFAGLSHAQISARLGISVKAVEKHITRALEDCERALGGRHV